MYGSEDLIKRKIRCCDKNISENINRNFRHKNFMIFINYLRIENML